MPRKIQPGSLQPKTKIVPLTANNLTTDIINRLNADGHCAGRINTMGVWDKRGFYRTLKKHERGKSDIIVCLAPLGLYAGIEVKIDEDEQSIYQASFEKRVKAAGGDYVIVKTQQDFFTWYTRKKEIIEYLTAATQFL